jgi:hypothetical protein
MELNRDHHYRDGVHIELHVNQISAVKIVQSSHCVLEGPYPFFHIFGSTTEMLVECFHSIIVNE